MQPSLPWSARPRALRTDHPPRALHAAGQCPRRRMDHRQRGKLAAGAGDAPCGAAAAHGSAAAARHPQLVLARIRHARRLLAFPGCVERAPAQGHARSERHGLPAPPARPRSTPAGNSWATGMCSSPCIAWPTRPRRSATPSPPSRPSPAARARLGKPRPDGNRRHHRPAGRGGHRVRGRLGAGRPARAHQDALGRYPVGALYRGAQRRGDIGRAIARFR